MSVPAAGIRFDSSGVFAGFQELTVQACVGAFTAPERVDATAPVEQVVTTAAFEHVKAIVSTELVGTRRPEDGGDTKDPINDGLTSESAQMRGKIYRH